jgi:hypothetical protein
MYLFVVFSSLVADLYARCPRQGACQESSGDTGSASRQCYASGVTALAKPAQPFDSQLDSKGRLFAGQRDLRIERIALLLDRDCVLLRPGLRDLLDDLAKRGRRSRGVAAARLCRLICRRRRRLGSDEHLREP